MASEHADVVIGTMDDHGVAGEGCVKFRHVDPLREGIDEPPALGRGNLDEANFLVVAVQAVSFGIESDNLMRRELLGELG